MEPKEALKLLTEATAQINTNRQTHMAMVEAINVLLRAITPQQAPLEPKTAEVAVG